MTTPFLGLTDAVKAALLVDPPVLPAARIKRGRNTALGTDETSGIFLNVRAADGDPLDVLGESTSWQTVVAVEIRARAARGQDAETAADALLQSTYARLRGMAAPPGAIGIALDPQIRWEIDEADQTLVAVLLALRITHLTTGAALEPATP